MAYEEEPQEEPQEALKGKDSKDSGKVTLSGRELSVLIIFAP